MKQTNNALKFLLAQYRSIFKNAFIKGLAPAIIVTSALAAAQANAADIDASGLTGEAISIDGTAGNNLKVEANSDSSITWDREITVTGGAKANNYIGIANDKSSGTFSGNGALIISDSTGSTDNGVTVSPKSANGALSISIKTLNIQAGALDIISNDGTKSGSTIFSASTILLGDGTQAAEKPDAVVLIKGTDDENATLGTFASGTAGTNSAVGSLITLNSDAKVIFSGAAASSGSVLTGLKLEGKGGLLDFTQGSGTIQAPNYYENEQGTAQVQNIDVGLGKTATIALNNDVDTAAGGSDVYRGVLHFASGSEIKLADDNATSGGSILEITKNTATKAVGSIVKIDAGTKLWVNPDETPATDNAVAHISVSGAGADKSGSILQIDNGVLTSFLTADAGHIEAEPEKADAAGALLLKGNATLALTSTDSNMVYELSGGNDATVGVSGSLTTLKLTSGASVGSGDAGNIVVNGSGNHFVADNIQVSNALADFNGATELFLDAKNLTLGKSDAASTQFKFAGATVTDKLTLLSNDDTGFKLQDGITLDRDSTAATAGVIDAANGISVSGASGALSFVGGTWSYDKAVDVQSNSKLNVTASGDSVDVKLTDLTLSGGTLTISGDASGAASLVTSNLSFESGSISVTGNTQTATLDASNGADFKSGSVTLSGNATAFDKDGLGRLIVNYSDFENVLTDTSYKTTLTIASGGLLDVKGFNTGSFNVSKFASGDGAANKIGFSGGGYLNLNEGDLNLVAYDGDTGTGDKLSIGAGTILAKNINMTTYSGTSGDAGTTLSESGSTLDAGTLVVAGNLNTANTSLNIGGGSSDAKVELNAGVGNTGSITIGNAEASKLNLNASGALSVATGNWTTTANLALSGAGSQLTVGTSGDDVSLPAASDGTVNYTASFIGNDFKAETGAGSTNKVLTVYADGSAQFNTMTLASGNEVDVKGYLKIVGDDSDLETNPTAGVKVASGKFTVDGAGATLEFDTKAANALVVKKETADGASGVTIELAAGGLQSGDNVTVTDFGQLKFNFDASNTYFTNLENVKYLINQFGIGTNGSTGYLNLGNAELGLNITEESGSTGFYTANWADIKDFAQIVGGQATTDKIQKSLITGIANTDKVKGHYGALQLTSLPTGGNLTLNGTTSLSNAMHFGGKFVSTVDGATAGVKLDDGASLALFGGGEIGDIVGSGKGDANGNASLNPDGSVNVSVGNNDVYIMGDVATTTGSIKNIDDLTIKGETNAKDIVTANNLSLQSNLTVTKDKSNGSQFASIKAEIFSGATLTADQVNFGTKQEAGVASVAGNVNTTDLQVNGELLNIGNIAATDLTLTADSKVSVGFDAKTDAVDEPTTENYDESKSYNGVMEITGTTTLNGGTLVADPEYGTSSTLVSLNYLSKAPAATDATYKYNAGTVDGDIAVLQNSIVGLGSESLAELKEIAANFQKNGSLEDPASNKDGYGAVLYLGKQVTIGAGQGVYVSAQNSDDFKKYITEKGVLANPSNSNVMYLGANTAVAVNADALANATGNNSLVSFAGTTTGTTTTKGTVIADGGDIVIGGNVRATTYNIFSNADIKFIDGSAYDVATTTFQDQLIEGYTLNGFLEGVVDAEGKLTLGLANNARAIMGSASNPVYDTIVAYARGYNGQAPAEGEVVADANKLYHGYTTENQTNEDGTVSKVEVKNYNYSNALLEGTIANGDGSSVEAVARLSAYAGTAQAAISAAQTTSDAVAGRFGMGAFQGNMTYADNTQGTAMWVAPVYKNHNSKTFDAQGLDYGVDMDLYGVALGMDYAVNPNLKIGVAANIGSGSADGQGNSAASLVSNDFNYYGVSAYAGYSMDAISVVGDITIAQVDNDIEANTSLGKISTSADSQNFSVGVTGQYAMNVNGVELAPHAGLRYSLIKLDNYDLAYNGTAIASFDADNMSVFSIPVGVTIAKTFETETYSVKPSFDLTLTGNFGDDSADGTVKWAGVDNLSTSVQSDVYDSFTYGATVGVAFKTGNFSLGAGLNYTGSSNADELGVNANARFVF